MQIPWGGSQRLLNLVCMVGCSLQSSLNSFKCIFYFSSGQSSQNWTLRHVSSLRRLRHIWKMKLQSIGAATKTCLSPVSGQPHEKRGCSSWRKNACVTQNISVTLPKLGRSTRSMHMMGNTPQSETSVGALRIPCFQGPGWSMARMGQEPLNEGRKGMVIRHAAFPWWVFFPHLWEGKRYHPLCHQTSNSTFRSSLSAADLTYYSLEKIAAFRRGDFISAPAHMWASLRTMRAPAQTKGLAPPFAPVLFHCVIISPIFCHGCTLYKCVQMYTVRGCIAVTGKIKSCVANTQPGLLDRGGIIEVCRRCHWDAEWVEHTKWERGKSHVIEHRWIKNMG